MNERCSHVWLWWGPTLTVHTNLSSTTHLPTPQAEGTRWVFHLHKVLQASLFIAHLVHSHGASVLVHCSDGCVACVAKDGRPFECTHG